MPFEKVSTDEVDQVMDPEYGGMWFMRDALGTNALGVTIMELEPGARGKEHDHSHDSQEEVYVCVEGSVAVDVEGDSVTLETDEALWLSPDVTRQLENRGDTRTKLVLVGTEVD